MSISLQELEILSFQILEKGRSVGKTSWDTRDPGVACDSRRIIIAILSLPTPLWREGSRQVLSYETISETSRSGLRSTITFGSALKTSTQNGSAGSVLLNAANGETIRADFVIGAVGRLWVPRFTTINGPNEFIGLVVHSAK